MCDRTQMPQSQYHFLCSVERETGENFGIIIIGNMCTKFQVDWTSTLLKTTLIKNFNWSRTDGRNYERTNEQTLKKADFIARDVCLHS